MEAKGAWDARSGPWGGVVRRPVRECVKKTFARLAALGRRPNDASRGLAILAYHGTAEDRRDPTWVDFSGQMSLLEDLGYRVVALTEAIASLSRVTDVEIPTVAITFDDGWASNLGVAFPELARRGWTSTVFVTSSFVDRRPFLSAEEVGGLEPLGVEVGNHTHSHPDLTRTPDDRIALDVEEANRRLEDLTGMRPRTFCYPFGLYSPRVRRAIASCGFVGACTGRVGFNRAGQDLHTLRRLTLDPGDGPRELRIRLAGGYDSFDRRHAWMDRER